MVADASGPKFRIGTRLETTGGPEITRSADELSKQLGWGDDRALRSGGDDG